MCKLKVGCGVGRTRRWANHNLEQWKSLCALIRLPMLLTFLVVRLITVEVTVYV